MKVGRNDGVEFSTMSVEENVKINEELSALNLIMVLKIQLIVLISWGGERLNEKP